MDWTVVTVAAVAAIPGLVAAILAYYARKDVRAVGHSLNSRVDELVAAARREGATEERERERERERIREWPAE